MTENNCPDKCLLCEDDLEAACGAEPGAAANAEEEGEESGCGWEWDHTWQPGDYECRECGADLSSWNEES